jgi:hypothetical protein
MFVACFLMLHGLWVEAERARCMLSNDALWDKHGLQGNKSQHGFNLGLDCVNPYVTLNHMVGLNPPFNL